MFKLGYVDWFSGSQIAICCTMRGFGFPFTVVFCALVLLRCAEDGQTPPAKTPPAKTAPCAKCDGWGFDDRHEPYEQPRELVQRFARGVGVMVDQASLVLHDDGSASMGPGVSDLGRAQNLCDGQRFGDQPSLGYCTGFFVGADIFITAGHCLQHYQYDSDELCRRTRVIFDFAYLHPPMSPLEPFERFAGKNVYRCKEVLHLDLDPTPMHNDIAVLRLDRPVEGRDPLAYRQEGQIAVGERVFMLGHPQGLPMKISTNGMVQEGYLTGQGASDAESGEGFFFDLEAFSGNSGGPVFNAKTGLVEGIMRNGSDGDWAFDRHRRCRVMGVCGVNVECPHYPGAHPIAGHAKQLQAWIRSSDPSADVGGTYGPDGGTNHVKDAGLDL